AHDIRSAQRIVEVAPVPVDARHARAQQELVAPHLVPEVVDLLRLREEAVPAQVEPVTVALDGLRETADLILGLEDEDVAPRLAEEIARGQTGRSGAEDERRR